MDVFLSAYLEEIKALCMQNHVQRMYAFGSVVDGRFRRGTSDIDLLVEFDKTHLTRKEISRSLLNLWIQLQELLQSKVDLITEDTVQGEYFLKYLNLYKVLIFENHLHLSPQV
jgi:predicted nucleotidyltransferase